MTVNDQLTSDAPRDPWAAAADEPTTATEIITAADRPDTSAETVAPMMIEGPVAGTTVAGTTTSGAPGGPLPPAGPPTAVWEAPPPAASRPGRSPKVVLIAAVLVTAIASSGITAGVMSAIGGTPAVAPQDGSTGRQGGPGGFGGGPRGGMPGDQDSGTTQQDPGTTPQQDTTTQEGTTGT
jgi:hypothetical protein